MALLRDTEPVLQPDQTHALARQIEAGVLARAARLDPDAPGRGDATEQELDLLVEHGERARQRFISANLGLVSLVTRSFSLSGPPSPDLYQEGCLGLIRAVERFDHRRGVRFSTYALFWIRAAVGTAAARQLGAAQLPTSRAEQLRAVRGLEAELAQRLGRPATVAELAAGLGRSPTWTATLLAHRAPQSLDALDAGMIDSLAPVVDELRSPAGTTWARELLAGLDRLERQVLELRLGFTGGRVASYAEVARTLRRPVGQVRRAERRGLEQLRAACPQQARDEL